MANQIPSFSSGANLVLYVDGVRLAYASNLSISDDMAHAPVGGIGSYNMDALEPTQYAVRGAFTITHYDGNALKRTGDTEAVQLAPSRAGGAGSNSFLRTRHFSPIHFLIQRTFDIEIYERINKTTLLGSAVADNPTTATNESLSATPAFVISDCRLTSYGLTFTPGQLVAENLTFIALALTDRVAMANSLPTA